MESNQKSFRNRANQNRSRSRSNQQRVANKLAAVAQAIAPTRRRRRNRGGQKGGGKITSIGDILQAGAGVVSTALTGSPAIGNRLYKFISGQGDYKVSQNSLMAGGPPSFASLDSGIRLYHREYVDDVKSSVDFANKTYQITPYNSTLFPWLSVMARMFDEFRFNGLVIYYNSTSGNAVSSTNNSLGVVGMVTIYDPSDPDLNTKRECEDSAGCTAGGPSNNMIHAVECKPRSNVLDRLYIPYEGSLASVDDIKFYSMGKVNVFTQGMQQAGITIGELWVSYDITFFKPKISPTSVGLGLASKGTKLSATGIATGLPFGSMPFLSDTGSLPWRYEVYGSNGYLSLPSGTPAGLYLMTIYASTNVASTARPRIYESGNIRTSDVSTFFAPNSSNYYMNVPTSANSADQQLTQLVFTKTDEESAVLSITWSGTIGFTSGSFTILMTTLDPAVLTVSKTVKRSRDKQLEMLSLLIDNPLLLAKLKESLLPDMPEIHLIKEAPEGHEEDRPSYDEIGEISLRKDS